MITIDLVSNLSLLVALSIVSGFIGGRYKPGPGSALLQGLVFGGAAVIGMLRPLELGPGLIFDGRSVMISMAGFYCGPIASVVAASMAAGLRIFQGGVGAPTGVLVILSSAFWGVFFHKRFYSEKAEPSTAILYSFGLTVHASMLLCMFTLPGDRAYQVFSRIGFPIILTYPLATILIGKILSWHSTRRRLLDALQKSKTELGATLYSIGDAVITTDRYNLVRRMNPVAERLTGWAEDEARTRPLDEVFVIINEATRETVENPARKVLAEGRMVGLANHTLLIGRDGTERPIADSGAPIKDSDGAVTGVVLVFRDQSDERRAEDALRQSERRLSTLIGNLPGMAYRCELDEDWTMRFVSDGALPLTGHTPDELVGNSRISYAELIHPDDREMVWNKVNSAISQGRIFTLEYRIIDAAGGEKWVWERGCAVFGADGKAEALEGFISDVTSRRKAAQDAEHARKDWENIFQAIGHLTLILDKNHTIIAANRAAIELTGIPENELIGRKCYEVLHKADHPPADCPLGKMKSTRRLEVEEMVVEALNRSFLVSCTPVFNEAGSLEKVIHIATDITERKQAQEALRQSEEHFRDLFERAPLGYQSLDGEGRFIEVNNTWLQTLGYSREDVLGAWFGDFLVPEQVEAFKERFPVFKAAGKIHSEFKMLHKDGSVRFISFEGSVGNNPDGSFRQTHCILSDITELKMAEEERARREARNLQITKAESLARMAGAIAHRFNNHLMAVTGNLEIAILDLPRNTSSSESLGEALEAARKAAELSKLMLTYLGQTPARREPVDLSELCRLTLPLLLDVMPKKVKLETDLPKAGPVLNISASQIQQVITNLVTNGHESMPDGAGLVKLSVKIVPAAQIPAQHRFPADWFPTDESCVCLEVSDSGSGIKGEDIANLFDPFFSSKFTGRGLGLPVVLGIVRAHRGVVTVESAPGRGSVFRVFLPLNGEEVIFQSDKAIPSVGPVEGGKVLLVEDEDLVRQLTADLLKRLHFEVVEAKNGMMALELFEQLKDEIKWVLCDLTMPGMDGWATMAALRRLSPGVPVIMVSGYDEARAMAGEHTEWPQAFLSKPYHMKQLRDAIDHALVRRTPIGKKEQPEPP